MDKITMTQLFKKGFKKSGEDKWTYNGDSVCVLDFYADWCAPCKALEPVLKDISNEYTNINFYKINVEDEDEENELFRIMSAPTVIIVSKNKEPLVITGTISRNKLENIIKTYDEVLVK